METGAQAPVVWGYGGQRLAGICKALRETILGVWDGTDDRAQAQRDVVTVFLVRALSAAILYLSQIVLARWMGKFEYGIYVSVWTMVLVLGGMGCLGLTTATMRLLPEYREQHEFDLARGLVRHGRRIALAAGAVIALLGLAALHLFVDTLTSPYVLPVYLALVCVPIIAFGDVQDGIGRGFGWMHVALVPPYILRPLLVLLAMAVAHAIGLPMSAATAAGAAVVATWLSAAVQLTLIERRLPTVLPPGPRRAAYGPWLATSLPLLAASFSEIVLQTADVLVMARYTSPGDVAVYFAAAKTMSLVMFIHYAVGSALAKQLSTLNARSDTVALHSTVRDAVRWTFWPSLAVAAGLLALGWPLLWLFGPQFTAGYPIMAILVFGFLGRAAMGPSEIVLSMLGLQRAGMATAATAAATSIALNLALVPSFGGIGAAIATAIALVLGALLNAIVARRHLGLDLTIWSSLRGATR
jgi:O-antigen/teichoic acid export membrane protein